MREFDAFLLVVDDIPWGGAFNPDLATLSLHDVARIEVLRGSAPVTYGATSFVGVIHVVHNAAAATTSYASARGGAYSSGGASVDLALTGSKTWKSRLTADVDRQGFADERTRHTRTRGVPRLQWKRGREGVAVSRGQLAEPATGQPPPARGRGVSTVTPLDANYNPAGAFVDEHAPRRVRSRAAGGNHCALDDDCVVRPLRTEPVPRVPDRCLAERCERGRVSREHRYQRHLRRHARDLAGTRWRAASRGRDFLFGNGEAGGATFTYIAPLSGATAPSVAEPSVLDLDAESRRAFSGAYAQIEMDPDRAVAPVYWDPDNAGWERRGESGGSTYVRPGGSAGILFGVREHGADHVRLFANYRDTFKPAAFDFSLAENEGILRPETARSYEAGVKVRAAGGRLHLEASTFRMNFQNLVTATVSNGLPSLQNAGATRFQGFEIAADARGPRHLSGRASYSFHDGRFTDFVQDFDGVNTQLAGNRFKMSARHLVSAGLILAPPAGIVGSLILKTTGDRYLNKRNTALASPFTTVDAGIGYRLNRWQVRIDGHNLTDARDPVSESELGESHIPDAVEESGRDGRRQLLAPWDRAR